jgi:murein DD-endopeptidase MepM/ murein hydrolase activator NlpD
MAKKSFSVIIVPHCAQKSKSLTLSHKTVRTLLTLSIISGLFLIFFLVDYFTMNVTRTKYRALRQENIEQKKLLTDYENSVMKLREDVQKFESYARKLSVMAGLRSPEVMAELGIGSGETPSGENGTAPDSPQLGQSVSLQDAKDLAQRAQDVGKSLDVLANYFETQTARLASTPTIWPTMGWVSSTFAYRDDPFTGKKTFHYGIDIATNFGNPVVATADGIVLSMGNDKIGGRNIVLSHGNGITTHYLHLSKFMNLKVGQKVKRGDIIGQVGKSGKALGPHLHYEVRVNNRPMNPFNYILEE